MSCAIALSLALAGLPGGARAGVVEGSPLALSMVADAGDARPTLILAQRAITREWGPSEDSLYRVIEIPEWRSEGLALTMSAAVPGAGQYYVGDPGGLWFLLAEAVGWSTHFLFDRQADDARGEAHAFAGDPTAPGSNWSFERLQGATNEDPSELIQMYTVDPNSFYRVIGSDERYLAGWSGSPAATRSEYVNLQDGADSKRRRARIAAGAIVINHVVSAVHALRAARLNNLPLRRNLELQLKPSWRDDGPVLMAVVRGRF